MSSVKENFAKFVSTHRLKPFHLAFSVLFVGWVPSLLLAYYSFSVLSRTLENKTAADSESLVRSLSQHVENELERTGESMDYYRTLPTTATMLQPPQPPLAPAVPVGEPSASPSTNSRSNPPALPVNSRRGRAPTRDGLASAAPATSAVATVAPGVPVQASPPQTPQEWLSSIYYPQKRIDGMFLTDASGRLVAAVPQTTAASSPQQQFSTGIWKTAAEHTSANYYVSSSYLRAVDGRRVTSIVVAVHDRAQNLLGFLGADVLIERIGRRLQSLDFGEGSEMTIQIIDQNGFPLFGKDLETNRLDQAAVEADLLRAFRKHRSGIEERGELLYTYAAVGRTGWIALTQKRSVAVHQPVHDLLRQTLLLVGWLVVGTAMAAHLLSSFYRRQLQSSLRIEREQIFNEKILANMPIGIALVDPGDERLLKVNGAFAEIVRSLGRMPRELEVAEATFTQLSIASREALARVLHFGVPFQAIEQRTLTAGGQTRYLTINLLRLQDSHQRTLGVLCLVEDSTAPVVLRQELINANASKDQFLAQLSHELRNPLSPVITMVAELESMAEELPATRQPLEIIRRNVELEARLIDDLLDVTRISSGKLQLNRSVTDVHRTLRLALEICQRDIDDKGIRVRLVLDAPEHHAFADPARLQQVFWNLLKNAVKFTPQGKRITVRSTNLLAGAGNARSDKAQQNPAVTGARDKPLGRRAGDTLAVFGGNSSEPEELAGQPASAGATAASGSIPPAGNQHGCLRIEVIDEGIGIEPQNLTRIFNAFDQGQSSITQRFGGLGLGLAISKAMVEAHGGSVGVRSEGTDQGAAFTVELETCPGPVNDPFKPATTVPGLEPARSPGRQGMVADGPNDLAAQRVLLIDDHIDTCLGMQRLLKRRGYEVVTAHSVAEGLSQHEAHAPFDLVISDLGLPDGTGFELMSELRRRGGPPGVALSGFGMESDIGKSHAAGFSEHLIKPVAIDRLDEVMRRLLSRTSPQANVPGFTAPVK